MAERKSKEFWQGHVAAFDASGERRAAYCRRHGLNFWTFDGWRRRLRGTASPELGLVPVMVDSPCPPRATPTVIEVRVGSDVSLSVPTSVDANWLGTLLRKAASC